MAAAKNGCLPPLLLLCLFCILQEPISALKKSYVVYMGGHSHSAEEASVLSNQEGVANSHYSFLGSFLGSKEKAQDAIFYSYARHINGFAANLEEEEAMEIAKHPAVVSVFPNRGKKLHTTHSWSFLHLERNGRVPKDSLWAKASFGQDTIIGNLDTGAWPESDSFRDDGMGPIPARWRGTCEDGVEDKFRCNRKLIGARYFSKGYRSATGVPMNATIDTPRDNDGHGSHTLSTAGGGSVPNANIFRFGNGTAKGGSVAARVAAYKVCFPPVNGSECFDADILAAFDAAISDGVDVLSVSLGGDPSPYLVDGLAIGSFHAVRKGVVVVCSAGNSGPNPATVSNLAPWILTVGASTTDREFTSYASLGDGNTTLKGQSLSPSRIPDKKLYPLINAADAKLDDASQRDAQLCIEGSLDARKAKGKIVACLRGKSARVEKGEAVLEANGRGMILANDMSSGNEIIADAHVLPAVHISYAGGLHLFSYINSTRSPMAYISPPETVLNTKPAPFMASFSSQGPNVINPEFIKPDITAPGVSILAAFTGAIGPTGLPFDGRRVPMNSESGTSMSCPHIAGVVGLLKTMYPHWSPSAIKSAIMTTARTRDNTKQPIQTSSFTKATPFNYGSGHVRPNRAMDPGLVYDITTQDYLNFLCSIGYNSSTIATIFSVDAPYSCPATPPSAVDLNYPSVAVPGLTQGGATVRRRLKNVGPPGTYKVRVVPPAGISVLVEPTHLDFHGVGEEKPFTVKLKAMKSSGEGYVFGRMTWSDGLHYVRSPLVVKTA